MKYNAKEHTVLGLSNKVDDAIVSRAGEPTEQEIYQARWVWYHTILAAEIFLTNILLIGILIKG
jgi:hypothetical protein